MTPGKFQHMVVFCFNQKKITRACVRHIPGVRPKETVDYIGAAIFW